MKVVKKVEHFWSNNLYFLKQGLAGASHVEMIYATGSQKSKSGDRYRRDANPFGIISRKSPQFKVKTRIGQ